MIHQSGEIVRPNLHGVVLERSLGLAVAAHIEIDATKATRQDRRCGSKIEMSEASAVDLDNCVAVAGLLIPDTNTIDSRVRHIIHPFGLLGLESKAFVG